MESLSVHGRFLSTGARQQQARRAASEVTNNSNQTTTRTRQWIDDFCTGTICLRDLTNNRPFHYLRPAVRGESTVLAALITANTFQEEQ